jgi:hypothetical protein
MAFSLCQSEGRIAMTEVTQTVWTRASVLALLESSEAATVRALKVIASRQTPAETQEMKTTVRNGRGFNARDANILTDIASKLPRYGDHLTQRQLLLVRGRLRKYVGQLLEAIEEKGGKVDYKREKSVSGEQTEDQPQETVQAAPQGYRFGAWS